MKYQINLLLTICLLIHIATPTLAAKIDPLPQDRVGEIIERIEKDENIDLKLIYQSLIGPQTALRAYAATYLGKHGDRTSIPYLIDALADESGHVGALYFEAGMATTRYRANDSLKRLAGRDFGFVWNDPKDKRAEAIKRWRTWWQTKPAIPSLPSNAQLKDNIPIGFDTEPSKGDNVMAIVQCENVTKYTKEIKGDWEIHW